MNLWIDFEKSIGQRLNCQTLDNEQNKAKNLRSHGAAIVRGVVGSGKSLVLRDRVSKLLEEFDDILVLTYNRFMSGWLKSKLANNSINVECKTFHQWAFHKLDYSYKSDRYDPDEIIRLARKSKRKYQAILIDEAQDFPDQWFQALLEMLEPETESLFIVYDNTQSVYGQPHRRQANWTWKSLGINIPGGRSQVFDINYRNSPEILGLAWNFIEPALISANIKVEKRERDESGKVIKTPGIGSIIEPKKKLSRSSEIKPILQEIYYEDMPSKIAFQLQEALKINSNSSIGILINPQVKNLQQEISQELATLNIEHHAPKTSRDRDGNVVDRPHIVVDSWNALKGVEFDAVIIAGVDSLEAITDDLNRDFEAKAGLYTAMTRARDHLVMLYENKNPTVDLIESALTNSDRLDYVE